jgi:hypothetical protein
MDPPPREPHTPSPKKHVDSTILDNLLPFGDLDLTSPSTRATPNINITEDLNSMPTIIFTNPETATGNLGSFEPDYSEVQRICDRYYPHIMKQCAPSSQQVKCAHPGCEDLTNGLWYQCSTCFSSKWLCGRCIISDHKGNPFHRIHEWNEMEQFSTLVSLEQLGLVVRFDGINGEQCKCSEEDKTFKFLEVYHTNGAHRIKYYQCGCNTDEMSSHTITPEQLISNGLFPATDKNPQRAFTFQLLHEYDILNLYGYVNIKQFLDAKVFISPNCGQTSDQVSHIIVCKLRLIRS